MIKKIEIRRWMLACIVATGLIADVLAGDVKLVSDTMDSVCRVEITWGPNAPDITRIEQFLEVDIDWSITKPDKLCYRRASTPDNCDSGMTQWNTQWRCATNSGAGVVELTLE